VHIVVPFLTEPVASIFAGNKYIGIAVFFIVVLLLSVWLAVIVWTWTDARARSRDPVIWIAATLVAIVPLAGILVYLILRPRQTLMEAYLRSLEEEALLQEIEERPVCPSCKHRIEPDYVLCPNCLAKVKAQCMSCKRLIEPDWTVCPYCATDRKFPVAVGSAES
jgi:RNA polymerase subunit RPABC4/transcription elongation factor Spt4